MSASLRTFAAACSVALFAGLTLAAQATPPQQQTRAVVPVRIGGCIERVAMPAGKPPVTSPVMYKLINTQPGRTDASGGDTTSRPPQPPAMLEPEYFLASVKPIDFSKYQNQRVEVTGVTSPTKAPEGAPDDLPRQTLTASAVQVTGTECRGGSQ
jgi:hypothetical protein